MQDQHGTPPRTPLPVVAVALALTSQPVASLAQGTADSLAAAALEHVPGPSDATTTVLPWALVLATSVSITDVPNPTPTGWVTDMANVLSSASEQAIDARIFALRRATGHEVAVVTVDDVRPYSPKAFATALFNHWGVGSAQRNDGVLVLLVVGQRRLEIEVGIGLESRLPEESWLRPMRERTMVPRFKRGDYGGGIEAGLAEIDSKLRGQSSAAVAPPARASAPAARGRIPTRTSTPASSYDHQRLRDPLAGRVVATNRPVPPVAVSTTRPTTTGDLLRHLARLFLLVAGGAGSVFGFLWLRKAMRKCPKCGSETVRLDELADDAHLSEAQRLEERIGSVDYKVYVCTGCGFTRSEASSRWFSGYSTCKACGSRTLTSTSTTLVHATYDQGGQVRVNESCVRCPHRHEYTRSTPPMTRPSSSSDSYSSSGGGSSFGGGHSGGGGGGSSW